MGPVLHRFKDLGFWQIAKGYGDRVGFILYDIEYSSFFLVLSRSQRELGVNGEKKKKKKHTYRRLGGVLLTLHGYMYGVSIGFVPWYY